MKGSKLVYFGMATSIAIELLIALFCILEKKYFHTQNSTDGSTEIVIIGMIIMIIVDVFLVSLYALMEKTWILRVIIGIFIIRCILSFGLGIIIWGIPLYFLIKGLNVQKAENMPSEHALS